jgi:hypothetical protein
MERGEATPSAGASMVLAAALEGVEILGLLGAVDVSGVDSFRLSGVTFSVRPMMVSVVVSEGAGAKASWKPAPLP